MLRFQRWMIWVATAVLLAGAGAPAWAQDTYPERPMRLIVPYPAGGGADLLARIVGKALTASLGQSVVVENRPGANGAVGAREAASLPADGYTMLLVTDGLYSVFPHFLPPGTDNPLDSLRPLIHLVDSPLVIAARPGLPARDLKEFIALAKASPGAFTFGANNTMSTHYFAAVVLQQEAGIELMHVPFSGTAAALPLLSSGQIDLLLGQITGIKADVESGRGSSYLAVTTAERFSLLPDVPSVAETIPGYHEPVALGLMVHADTPPARVARLNAAVNQALGQEDVRRIALEQTGGTVTGGTPEAFGALITRQLAARAATIAAGDFAIR